MGGPRWLGLTISVAVHAALVGGLFLAPPPERPARSRPPTKIRLVTAAPREAKRTPAPAKSPEPPDWRPVLPTPDALPVSTLPPTPPPTPPPAAKAEKAKPPKPKKATRPTRRRKKRRTRKAKPSPSKPPAPATVARPTPEARPKAKKFRYDMPAGPGGTVALPAAQPGEGGHRFGAVDGDPNGALGGRWAPRRDDRERAPATPATDAAPPIVDVTETTRAPKLLSKPSSADLRRAYPEEARREGREADVHLRVLVNERGGVARVKVVRKAGHGFDEAAARLAKKLRFEPGRRGGERVRVWVSFPFKFRLNEG